MKTALELPSDWAFVEVVFPAMRIGEPTAHVTNSGPLVDTGLKLIAHASAAQTRAILRGVSLEGKSGLKIPVAPEKRDEAHRISRRFSREAADQGYPRWSTRQVLLAAIFLASINAGLPQRGEVNARARQPRPPRASVNL